jgi:hypothetical protein
MRMVGSIIVQNAEGCHAVTAPGYQHHKDMRRSLVVLFFTRYLRMTPALFVPNLAALFWEASAVLLLINP